MHARIEFSPHPNNMWQHSSESTRRNTSEMASNTNQSKKSIMNDTSVLTQLTVTSQMATEKRKPVSCVVAIDLGTTFSGYAYSMVEKYKKDKLDIKTNQPWNSGTSQLISHKTATALLLTKSGEFKSFGYEAETDYHDILLDDTENADNFLYFRRFKMDLFTRRPTCSMLITDIQGRVHSALDVFSFSIRALKEHVLKFLQLKVKPNSYDEDDIKWTLTVPAIWTDEAKMFMRRAGEKAGIPDYRLVVAREPEAAALYCQRWYTQTTKQNVFQNGTKYLVVDIGGGTVDICGHEVLRKGLCSEFCAPKGCAYGGTSIDKEFSNIFLDILGNAAMVKFKSKHVKKYLDLMSDFEYKKRTLSSNCKPISIRIPIACLNQLNPNSSFNTLLQASKYAGNIHIRDDTMVIGPDFSKFLFFNSIREIESSINDALTNGTNVSVILVVGGLSENTLVQDSIKEAFPDKTVIIPDDPTLAVLRGAVMFGHQPDVVTTRVTQYYYGRKIKPVFNAKIHDRSRMVNVGGEARCDGVFEVLMKSGTHVPVGKRICKKYHTISVDQEYIRVCLYKSITDKTKYIDDEGCSLVGECLIPVISPSVLHREISVQFEFGDTELSITATDMNTKQEFKDKFHLE